MLRVCIFMNVFNVHVNRSPVRGKIKKLNIKREVFLMQALIRRVKKMKEIVSLLQLKMV